MLVSAPFEIPAFRNFLGVPQSVCVPPESISLGCKHFCQFLLEESIFNPVPQRFQSCQEVNARFLTRSSAFSFPSTPTCPGTQAMLVLLTSKFSLCRHSHRGPDDSRTQCQDDYSHIQHNGNALSKLSSVQIPFKLGNLFIASEYSFLGPNTQALFPSWVLDPSMYH